MEALVVFGIMVIAALAPGWPCAAFAGPPQTLKERLSDKASDEQRVDNCKVPPERRGLKPRPDCPVAGSSAHRS